MAETLKWTMLGVINVVVINILCYNLEKVVGSNIHIDSAIGTNIYCLLVICLLYASIDGTLSIGECFLRQTGENIPRAQLAAY